MNEATLVIGAATYDFHTLTGVATHGVFDGTLIDQTDAHGANRMGTFHAVRRAR